MTLALQPEHDASWSGSDPKNPRNWGSKVCHHKCPVVATWDGNVQEVPRCADTTTHQPPVSLDLILNFEHVKVQNLQNHSVVLEAEKQVTLNACYVCTPVACPIRSKTPKGILVIWLLKAARTSVRTKWSKLSTLPNHCSMHLVNASLSHWIMRPCSSTWSREQQVHVVSFHWKVPSCSSPSRIPRQ